MHLSFFFFAIPLKWPFIWGDCWYLYTLHENEVHFIKKTEWNLTIFNYWSTKMNEEIYWLALKLHGNIKFTCVATKSLGYEICCTEYNSSFQDGDMTRNCRELRISLYHLTDSFSCCLSYDIYAGSESFNLCNRSQGWWFPKNNNWLASEWINDAHDTY